ncbi:hypothetical protein MKX03_029834 [Papaver bracteatum]|nr:hypothetical protein MKX03_029834 [Papaver bracteatum]
MASLSHPVYMQLSQQSVIVEPIHQQHIMRNDRHPFSTSDDNVITNQIQSTHSPDGREVDVTPILHLCEDIFESSTVGTILESNNQAHMDALEDKTKIVGFRNMLEALAYTINKILCEVFYFIPSLHPLYVTGDAHVITLNFLNLLSSYSWDAKVVLTLAALAVNYGEFWLVAKINQTNQLAKSIAILKHLPYILEHSDSLKPRFDALKNLIKSMMDVTKCVVQFKSLPPQYINPDTSEMSIFIAHTPTAVYWTMRSVVAWDSQIVSLIGFVHEYLESTTEAWELSILGHKLSNIHDNNRHVEVYQTLVRMFETSHIDNLKILKALIYPNDDIMPLYDGSNKKRVTLDVLRRKNVLLLISYHEMPHEELTILKQMYMESRHQPIRIKGQYEVIWIPIALRSLMPWFTVHHPSLIDQDVIKYIKEIWHFSKKPIIVVLDPHVRVVCLNALHMMWIWGSLAFPFTTDGGFICVYGGENMEWIRKFTATTRVSNPRERVRKNITIISLEKLSYCWQDLTSIWFFWVRLESMWYSKMQLVLTSLTQFDSWKIYVEEKGFLHAMNDHLHTLHMPHHCNRIVLPGTSRIPEVVVCAECGQTMEKFIMYRCCTD